MELWIPITIAAAFLQNVRSALQKALTGRLSPGGATYSRFCYALPFIAVYVAVLVWGFDFELPAPNLRFAVFAALGGIAQITGTFALVYLFTLRNFAVGNAYSKTETVQTALVGIVVLGDPITGGVAMAMLVALGGVVALSVGKGQLNARSLLTGFTDRAALMGIGSGALFGLSAVFYRAAALSLADADSSPTDFWIHAAFTLALVLIWQTLVMGAWLAWREPGQLKAVLGAWKIAGYVGASGTLASIGWFTAMTIQNAAYVRALGQIELVFTFIVSTLVFREKSNAIEIVGIALIVSGILILVLQ